MIIKRKMGNSTSPALKDAQGQWTNYAKKAIWDKAETIPDKDPSIYRLDPCGDMIKWDEYANDHSPLGWEIDHTYPESTLKDLGVPQELIDDLRNLRPMQASNNVTKQNHYPVYPYKKEVLGQIVARDYEVNKHVQNDLKDLYKDVLPRTIVRFRALAGLSTNAASASTSTSSTFLDTIVTPSAFDNDD